MSVIENLNKAFDIMGTDEKTRKKYLEKLEESNSIITCNSVLQSVAYDLNNLMYEKDDYFTSLDLELKNTIPFCFVWNHVEAETVSKNAFNSVSSAISCGENLFYENIQSESVVFLCFATLEELQERYKEVFGESIEFDEEEEIEESLLSSLFVDDFIFKEICTIGN